MFPCKLPSKRLIVHCQNTWKKNYSYALKFSILDLSPKVTFFIFKLEQKKKKKKKVQLFLIHAWAEETHFVLVKAR